MNNKINITNIVLLVLLWPSISTAEKLKMPMPFSPTSNPYNVLKTYPLGFGNKVALQSHHGKADRVVTLPNGHEGWVYYISKHHVPKIYTTPDGKRKIINEGYKADKEQTYTIVFSMNDSVIDVIYNNKSSGMSALIIQFRNNMDH